MTDQHPRLTKAKAERLRRYLGTGAQAVRTSNESISRSHERIIGVMASFDPTPSKDQRLWIREELGLYSDRWGSVRLADFKPSRPNDDDPTGYASQDQRAEEFAERASKWFEEAGS